MTNGKALVVVDFSNWLYYTIHGATSAWAKTSENAIVLKSAEETDQENLPNLLVYSDYKRTLANYVHKRLDTVNWIVRQNHQDEVDSCSDIDVIFTMDDNIENNFRKKLFPGYKAQRKLKKNQYDINKVRDYIVDVMIPDLKLKEEHGYVFVKVDGCESDDIIATIMKNFTDYSCRILVSSDHDFLQLDDVYQYDMAGNRITREVCGTELDAKDFLLWKIIRGDLSDNIAGVFKGVGEKKALKLVNDKPKLKMMLKESQDTASRYNMNRKLIDFSNIPTELNDTICEKIRSMLKPASARTIDLVALQDDMLSF